MLPKYPCGHYSVRPPTSMRKSVEISASLVSPQEGGGGSGPFKKITATVRL